MTPLPIHSLLHGVARLLRKVRGRLTGPSSARVGSEPTWGFRAEILDGGQVRSLAELRGKALLIQFIGLG